MEVPSSGSSLFYPIKKIPLLGMIVIYHPPSSGRPWRMRRSLWRMIFPFYMPLKHLPTVKKYREQVLFAVCAVTPADGIPLAVQIRRTHAVAE